MGEMLFWPEFLEDNVLFVMPFGKALAAIIRSFSGVGGITGVCCSGDTGAGGGDNTVAVCRAMVGLSCIGYCCGVGIPTHGCTAASNNTTLLVALFMLLCRFGFNGMAILVRLIGTGDYTLAIGLS